MGVKRPKKSPKRISQDTYKDTKEDAKKRNPIKPPNQTSKKVLIIYQTEKEAEDKAVN